MNALEAIDSYGLKPGVTIYTKKVYTSQSGMLRVVDVYVVHAGEIHDISWLACQLLGYKFHRKYGGVTVKGSGFSAGFDIVYALGSKLYPEGFECIGEGCPSNDHANGDREYKPHHHASGGYVFKHKGL